MLMLPPTVRVYVAVEPVDLRKGFDGLACVVRQVIVENPLSGHLFVFFNRRSDITKILFWTRSGYTIVHKRLEKGRFFRLCGAPHKRKNYLFAGSDAFAERAATLYTLMGTCALVGADPLAYFTDVLRKLETRRFPASRLDELLPPNWIKTAPESARVRPSR